MEGSEDLHSVPVYHADSELPCLSLRHLFAIKELRDLCHPEALSWSLLAQSLSPSPKDEEGSYLIGTSTQ